LNLHLLKHNWPPVNILPEDRDRYLDGLREGNAGNLLPLTEYLMNIMGGALLNFLSQVGTEQDELIPLAELHKDSTYSAKYLSLRAGQGELPAVRIGKGWNSSKRALELYVRDIGKR